MCCRFVRKLLAVAFLPVIAIRPAFIAFESHRLTQRNPAIRSLLDYYSATWLDGDYALVMWNVHGQATRTNNRVEGWHSRLNKAIGAPHPNTHQLVDALKVEQAATELTVTRARLGAAPAPRRRRYRDWEREGGRGEGEGGREGKDGKMKEGGREGRDGGEGGRGGDGGRLGEGGREGVMYIKV